MPGPLLQPTVDQALWDALITRPMISLPFTLNPPTTLFLVGGPGIMCGWAFVETTNVAGGWVKGRDGEDVNAPLIVWIKVLQNQDSHDGPHAAGPLFKHAFFLDWTGNGGAGGVFWVRV